MVFFEIFCTILVAKLKFHESLTINSDLCTQIELRSQFLRMFSRFGWLYGKVNFKIFEKSFKKEMQLQNAVFI